MDKPLEGIKVFDLSHVGAGPYCTMMLAQLGAEVTKVEPTGQGEFMRAGDPQVSDGAYSYYFASVNAGKRFLQLDLKEERGRDIAYRLIEESDVVVENMRPGVVERLGVDYETVRDLRPDIIYCSISGFRRGSKYETLPSFDYVHEAMSGVMSMTRHPDEAPPLPGLPAADMAGSVYGALGITMALYHRQRTGQGQIIEVPLQDCLVSLLPLRLGYTYASGASFPALGRYHRDFAPFGIFPASDGDVFITAASDALWAKLVSVLPQLDRSDFSTIRDRLSLRDELHAELRSIIESKSTKYWVDLLRTAGVPVAPIMGTDEVVADDYMREIVTSFPLGSEKFTWLNLPISGSELRHSLDSPSRPAGHDTTAILDELGYSAQEQSDLRLAGVVGGRMSGRGERDSNQT